jgi:uncharacterized protein YndB with AHSA1/START domain
MRPEVTFEVIYPYPPERVWRALTDRRVLAQWLLPNDFEPQVGCRFHFVRPGMSRGQGRGDRELIECEVVDLQPPFRLAYTWRASSERTASLVTWTLEPVSGGTRLRLTHTRADAAAALGSEAAAAVARAWERRMAALRSILEYAPSEAGCVLHRGVGGNRWRTTGSFDGARAW